MKMLLPVGLVASSLLLFAASETRAQSPRAVGAFQEETPSSGDLQSRVSELERTVADVAQSNRALQSELKETSAYLERLAGEAKTLTAKLDECQSLGFTAGINPQSRVVLLSALKSFLAEQQNLPAPEKDAKNAKNANKR